MVALRKAETIMGLDVPSGYRVIAQNSRNIVYRKGYEEAFENFAPPGNAQSDDDRRVLSGRGPLAVMPLNQRTGERVVIRRCLRGGILGRIIRETYLKVGNPRPLEELKIANFARTHGVETPEILAVMIERIGPFFYRGTLAIREIRAGRDLLAELLSLECPPDQGTIAQKRRTIARLGCLIAKMHDAGIYHADLHLKNILVSEAQDTPKLYVLDFDAARIFPMLSDFRRTLNILRLYRSVLKVNKDNRAITRTDAFRFLHSYAGESSRSVRELIGKIEKMLPFWHMKWKISDMFGV
jgi:tRNA A-37 threonylcarbamoyl transferase component Bud32